MIFIIDDNDANLAMAAAALENDYRVLTLPGAKSMFRLLEKKQPDLILLDIEMPEMDGFEAIAQLKSDERYQDIPVVFLTGRTDKEFEEKARNAPVLDIIQKPFVADDLLEKVKKFV